MVKKYSSLEKLTAFFLLLLLVVAVFPLEQPGMLEIWYGTTPNIIFTFKFLRLTSIELLLVISFIFAYLSSVTLRRVRYHNNFGLIMFFFIACIVWGYIGTVVSHGGMGEDTLGTGYWKKLVYGMLLFVILTLFFDSRRKIFHAMLAIAMACIILDIYGMGRYIFFGGLSTEKYIGKVVFWETVKLSLNVFVLILSTGMLFFSDTKISRFEKITYYSALALTVVVIFVSSRRTSMIMAMIAGMMYLWLLFKSGRVGKAMMIISAGGILVLLVVMFNYETFETKFLSRIESVQGIFSTDVKVDAGSTQGHMDELSIGWATVMENPVWGVGFSWDNESAVGTERFWVHNAMLTFWMRFGIVGAITYFYLYFKILTVLWSAMRQDKTIVPFIFFTWFFVEFLSGLFFPPFFGYFKSSALFLGTLAIINGYLNTSDSVPNVPSNQKNNNKDNPDRILRRKSSAVLTKKV